MDRGKFRCSPNSEKSRVRAISELFWPQRKRPLILRNGEDQECRTTVSVVSLGKPVTHTNSWDKCATNKLFVKPLVERLKSRQDRGTVYKAKHKSARYFLRNSYPLLKLPAITELRRQRIAGNSFQQLKGRPMKTIISTFAILAFSTMMSISAYGQPRGNYQGRYTQYRPSYGRQVVQPPAGNFQRPGQYAQPIGQNRPVLNLLSQAASNAQQMNRQRQQEINQAIQSTQASAQRLQLQLRQQQIINQRAADAYRQAASQRQQIQLQQQLQRQRQLAAQRQRQQATQRQQQLQAARNRFDQLSSGPSLKPDWRVIGDVAGAAIGKDINGTHRVMKKEWDDFRKSVPGGLKTPKVFKSIAKTFGW
jgi:hypothetical protein